MDLAVFLYTCQPEKLCCTTIDSYVTVDQVSTTTEVSHYYYYEEHVLVLNLQNDLPPSPCPQTCFIRQINIYHADNIIIANHPAWKTGNGLIFHPSYTPGHVWPKFSLALSRIQYVFANKKLTSDKKARAMDAYVPPIILYNKHLLIIQRPRSNKHFTKKSPITNIPHPHSR